MSSTDLGVQVEMGQPVVVRDDKGKFTTYTLNFRIAEETHSFTSRYAKLYKFHESLLKNEDFQKSFGYNPPDFPPKSWFTDFTKPKNYKKRAKKLEKYFKILCSRPSVLRNKQFQKGINLPSNLQKLIKQIAKGLQSKYYIEKNFDKMGSQQKIAAALNAKKPMKNTKKSSHIEPQQKNDKMRSNKTSANSNKSHHLSSRQHATHSNSMEYFEKLEQYAQGHNDNANIHHKHRDNKQLTNANGRNSSDKHLEILLKNLEHKTDEMFIDIVDGFGFGFEIKDQMDQYHENVDDKVINMYLFEIEQVLPKHLMHTADDQTLQYQKRNDFNNMDLFKMMNENDINDIDDIALDIRDAIINACEISVD